MCTVELNDQDGTLRQATGAAPRGTPLMMTTLSIAFPMVVAASISMALFVVMVSTASASLILAPGGTNTPCALGAAPGKAGEVSWNWTFAPPEAAAVPPPAGPWTATVNTTAAAGGVSVVVTVQHTPGDPKCDTLHGPNANPMVMPSNKPLIQAASGGATNIIGAGAQVSHGDHRDLARFDASVTPRGVPLVAAIAVEGKHNDTKVPVAPSVQNFNPVPIVGTINPDYRLPTGEIVIVDISQLTALPANMASEEVLSPFPLGGGEGGTLASFTWTYRGSPTTQVTAAFVGLVDGVVSELDLDAAIDLFTDGSGFIVPVLQSGTTDLFIGVDLTQWTTSPTPFSPLEVFDVTLGTSELLPGFVIGTSPIFLGSTGFETANPFTGAAIVGAALDGHIVPGPTSVSLMMAGLVSLGIARFYLHRARRPGRRLPGGHGSGRATSMS